MMLKEPTDLPLKHKNIDGLSFKVGLRCNTAKQRHKSFSLRSPFVDIWSLSCAQLFMTPETLALKAPLSMGFPRQECQSELPFPSPGDLPDPGIESRPPALQVPP